MSDAENKSCENQSFEMDPGWTSEWYLKIIHQSRYSLQLQCFQQNVTLLKVLKTCSGILKYTDKPCLRQ